MTARIRPAVVCALFIGAMLSFACPVAAQLEGELSRIVVRPTTLKVEFNVQCGGQRFEAMSENDVTLTHDGAPLAFQGWRCSPDGMQPFSTVMLLDASEGMTVQDVASVQVGCTAFIDSMDGIADEATIMMFRDGPVVIQQMTTIKPMLYSAVSRLSSVASRYTYYALDHAVREASSMSTHNATSVILIVSGDDEGSVLGKPDVLNIALQRGVRIFVIALGAEDVGEVEILAGETDGAFFRVQSGAELSAALLTIQRILRELAENCSVILPLLCTDGLPHTIGLTVQGCDSAITRTAVYTAPSSGVSAQKISFSLDTAIMLSGDTILLPVRLETVPITGSIYPLNLTIVYDPGNLAILGAHNPSGTLFTGAALRFSATNDRITVGLDQVVPVSSTGVCFYLAVVAKSVPQRLTAVLQVESILSGCGDVSLKGSHVLIYPESHRDALDILSWNDRETLMSARFTAFCDGSPIPALEASQLMVSVDGLIFPVTSLTRRSESNMWEVMFGYTCRDNRQHILSISAIGACSVDLDGVLGILVASTLRNIAIVGPSFLCNDDSTVLDAGAGFTIYRWNTGESTRKIVVRKPDIYVAAVGSAIDSCIETLPVVIITGPVSPKLQPPGPHEMCSGASIQLTLPHTYTSYRWSTGSTEASITVSQSGEYFATVVDAQGCTMQTDTMSLIAADSLYPSIEPAGTVSLCEGGNVILDAGGPWARYEWSNGFQGKRVMITEPGEYFVRVWNLTGCSGTSESVVVRRIPNPRPTLQLDGNPVICEGDSVRINVPGESESVLWSTGDTVRSIIVHTAGTYWAQVVYSNGCGAQSDTVRIDVRPRPNIPTIMRNGNTLNTFPANGYQWYRNGVAIPGATSYVCDMTETGRYQVEVLNAQGCRRMSDFFDVTVLDVHRNGETGFSCSVFPEPSTGMVTVTVATVFAAPVSLRMTDITGRTVWTADLPSGLFRHAIMVDLRRFAAGVYILDAMQSMFWRRMLLTKL